MSMCLFSLFVALAASSEHVITVPERLLTPEDGLLLGNGDLSVSVYQAADRILWRFGKNDVWDRRLDFSDDPAPADINEIAHGIEVEGWKCPPYGGPVEATKGTDNPQRMNELCVGAPDSYNKRPYPCPKPLGELAMQLPQDQMGLQLEQRLLIEQGMLEIRCTWRSGVTLTIGCFVHPAQNALVVNWEVSNWTPQSRTGNSGPPVWFSLYRWADPDIRSFGARFEAEYRHGAFKSMAWDKVTPLPPPSVTQTGGAPAIEQTFPPDPTFPQGFKYLLAPVSPAIDVQQVDMTPTGEARLRLMPRNDAAAGQLAVLVTTNSDPDGPDAAMARATAQLSAKFEETVQSWRAENRNAAADFWAKSSVRVADPLIENLWYETLHARRCTNRPDTPPPGLFLPSTVQDYSHWHGDYHTNYNLQEPFWGDYTANHFDLGDAYFKAIDYLIPIGRTIACDYYHTRGVFFQLSGYPILHASDPLGCVPMGRMAYMTGWVANQYWWRYKYSMDKEWLRNTGYPVIRDAALFYTDFLKKGEDGLYHAFPSNQGEDGFSGNAKDYTDRPQVMRHLRYTLRAAVSASEVLDTDADLRAEWRERLEHCAGDDGMPLPVLSGMEKVCYEANPPEFGVGRPYRPQPETIEGAPWPAEEDGFFSWYFGQFPWSVMQRLRAGDFVADRDFPMFRKMIERWRHPNGLCWGMAIANYGHAGAWTESLGVLAPLQETMLQSWDGAIRLFPAWPRNLDASFTTLRAEGAFLVSATWQEGLLQEARIVSEHGGLCRVWKPWETVTVLDAAGNPVAVQEQDGIAAFETAPGGAYTMSHP